MLKKWGENGIGVEWIVRKMLDLMLCLIYM